MLHVTRNSSFNPDAFPALILNADYTPLYPIKTLGWQDSIKDTMANRVTVVDYHDVYVRTAGGKHMELPAVVALTQYRNFDKAVSFTRMGVYMRDRFSCCYCGNRQTMRELTFDHVIPSSKGGKTTWTNIVTACHTCNIKKSDKSPKEARMPMLWQATVPTHAKLNDIAKSFPPQMSKLHRAWLPWIGIEADDTVITATEEMLIRYKNTNPAFPEGMTDQDYWDAEIEGN